MSNFIIKVSKQKNEEEQKENVHLRQCIKTYVTSRIKNKIREGKEN
jgi:hypothetical protein